MDPRSAFGFWVIALILSFATIEVSASGDVVVECEDGHPPPSVVIEMVHLQDLSSSYTDDLAEVQAKLPEVVDLLAEEFQGSKFGVWSYVDKPVDPFGDASYGDYCSKRHVSLTNDRDEVKDAIKSFSVKYGLSFPENQLEILHHAARSNLPGWNPNDSDEEGRPILRIISLATDASWHIAGEGKEHADLRPNDGDAEIDCTGEDYPTEEQVADALKSRNAVPLFLITENYIDTYTDLMHRLGIPNASVVPLAADSSNILEAIAKGVSNIVCASTTTTTTTTSTTTSTSTTTVTSTTTTTSTSTTTTFPPQNPPPTQVPNGGDGETVTEEEEDESVPVGTIVGATAGAAAGAAALAGAGYAAYAHFGAPASAPTVDVGGGIEEGNAVESDRDFEVVISPELFAS